MEQIFKNCNGYLSVIIGVIRDSHLIFDQFLVPFVEFIKRG
jgi:hypothetical protein